MPGVGAGVAVGVAYSNVVASVEDGAQLTAGGDITIAARTGSTPVEDTDADRTGALAEAFDGSEGVSFTDRTIRAISITGAGGIAGVSVAVASINIYSNAIAYLEGDVNEAANLTVSAVSDYPLNLAATLTASGGVAAVGASVALVNVGGNTEASIVGDAQVDVAGTVKLTNNLTTNAVTGAAAIGGGCSLGQWRGFAGCQPYAHGYPHRQGVRLTAGRLEMLANASTSAKTYIIGVSAGGTAIGVNAQWPSWPRRF